MWQLNSTSQPERERFLVAPPTVVLEEKLFAPVDSEQATIISSDLEHMSKVPPNERKKDTKRYFSSHRNNNNVTQYDGGMREATVLDKRTEGGGAVRPRDVDGDEKRRKN